MRKTADWTQPSAGTETRAARSGLCRERTSLLVETTEQGREMAAMDTCHRFPTSTRRSPVFFPPSFPWGRHLEEPLEEILSRCRGKGAWGRVPGAEMAPGPPPSARASEAPLGPGIAWKEPGGLGLLYGE